MGGTVGVVGWRGGGLLKCAAKQRCWHGGSRLKRVEDRERDAAAGDRR